MYCSKCGTPNADNAAQCVNCGQPFPAPAGAPQPTAYQRPPDIPTRLPQAILVTLFCCQPFGIVAIVFAALTSSSLSSGDYARAMDNSQKATTWCWVAFWLGFVPWMLWLGFMIIGGIAGNL